MTEYEGLCWGKGMGRGEEKHPEIGQKKGVRTSSVEARTITTSNSHQSMQESGS